MDHLENPNPPVAVSTRIFESAPEEAMFWIGKTSQDGEIFRAAEEAAAHQLCAETYHNVGIMAADRLAAKENTSDGHHEVSEGGSSRFVVLSRGSAASPHTVVATMKTIHRTSLSHPLLPIEELFPDVFSDGSRSAASLEISKTASRHPDNTIQNLAFLACIRASFIEAVALGSEEMLCVTEEFVERLVKDVEIPYEKLCEPRPFRELRSGPTLLVPLAFNVSKILSLYKSGNVGLTISTYLDGMEEHKGLGFFGPDLIKPLVKAN
jgi:hypothetical protein